MTNESLNKLRVKLSIKSKNGIDFTLSAGIIWIIIGWIWTLNFKAYDKSVFTFIIGALMIPLALLFSKLFKTIWTDKDNPLQPLGLWLNFAQLFYFPFLVFSLIKFPDYFVMVYSIITGGNFFLFSCFYRTNFYAVFAGITSIGAMSLGLILSSEKMYFIPILMSVSLIILTILLFFDSKKKKSIDLD